MTSRVVGRSPSVWYSTVTIDKGTSSGVSVDDPVVAADGLAGKVTSTTRGTAQVTLITDAESSVTARVLPTGATGIVEPNVGDPEALQLNFVQNGENVAEGEMVVTAGFSTGDLSSVFPPGIPIGKVTDASLEEHISVQGSPKHRLPREPRAKALQGGGLLIHDGHRLATLTEALG